MDSATDSISAPISSCPQHLVDFVVREQLQDLYKVETIEELPSAQQSVWMLQLGRVDATLEATSALWKECLQMGRNRIVIRQWKGGSQWWNLHQASDPRRLARTELWGYKQSRVFYQKAQVSLTNGSWSISIPRILYSSLDDEREEQTQPSREQNQRTFSKEELPWAILEYVGPHSLYCTSKPSMDGLKWVYDDYYSGSMVKVRHEYGFDEPHPRWGRVPSKEALTYAKAVLQQVITPIHQQSASTNAQPPEGIPVYDYAFMIRSYQSAVDKLLKEASTAGTQSQSSPYGNPRMTEILHLLFEAVYETLPSKLSKIPPMNATLVHMDLQPQNLLWSQSNDIERRIVSVLDWEDAAWADPRFELVLLGRKVCATREQADVIWFDYKLATLGPLEPWLQLETIHSLLTLLLQKGGGRNHPWETSQDTWDKLQREVARWNAMSAESTEGAEGGVTPEQDLYLEELGIHPEHCYRDG